MSHLLKTHYGGWRPQTPDHRDHEFLPAVPRQALPAELELDVASIPVLDQGRQGSCVGHGTAGIVMFDQHAQGEPVVVPSREFIYWNARDLEGTAGQDAGAEVRDGVKVIETLGVPADSDFPYDDQVFDRKPPARAYADATRQEALVYETVRYGHLHQAIASGFPFVFGFTCYESLESEQVAQTGVLPVPQKGEQPIGGHCVLAYGYNARYAGQSGSIPPRYVKCRNSWGAGWGDHGDFYLPQAYFDAGLAADFWVVRRIGAK